MFGAATVVVAGPASACTCTLLNSEPLAGAAGLHLASSNRMLPSALGIGTVVLLAGALLVRPRLHTRP